MTALVIQGGRIIDPARGIDETGSILIENGKISRVDRDKEAKAPAGCDVLLAEGMIVCPGFIDLHCHLRQPGFEDKETIATGTMAAARGGFTTVCCMPNTNPALDSSKNIRWVLDESAKSGAVRVLPIACVSVGREGKVPVSFSELAAAGVAGFSDDGSPVMDTALMINALRAAKSLELPVIDHCEDTNLTKGGVMNQGRFSISLGMKGMPAAAEEIMVARDIELAGMTGGWVHIAHASTEESVNIIRRGKQAGIRVTAEVTPHHLTLTEDKAIWGDANAKVNPPLRTESDIEALILGLNEGVIDIIATDHAPHTTAEKAAGIEKAPSGISVFETALGSLMGLVHTGRIDLKLLISKLTSGPAQILGGRYGNIGTLAVGAEADIVIFDPEKEWLVDTGKFASKGKNTPLAGTMLKGKVMATIYGGEFVYRDASVNVEEAKPKKI